MVSTLLLHSDSNQFCFGQCYLGCFPVRPFSKIPEEPLIGHPLNAKRTPFIMVSDSLLNLTAQLDLSCGVYQWRDGEIVEVVLVDVQTPSVVEK
jgi:hypothetical protein